MFEALTEAGYEIEFVSHAPCPLLLVGMPASLVSFSPEALIEPEPEDRTDEEGRED